MDRCLAAGTLRHQNITCSRAGRDGKMNSVAKLLIGMVFTVSLALPHSGAAAPPIVFNPDDYRAMADADSPATIPPGTRITVYPSDLAIAKPVQIRLYSSLII
jgi:hypothetical protein